MGKIAVIDCQISGISGDMLLSSLVDAGANKKKVVSAIFECQNFLKGSTISEVNFTEKIVGGFRAPKLVRKYRDEGSAREWTDMYASRTRCCEHKRLVVRAH